jgi:predicted cupin superfamily sugar epimerase
MRPQIVVPGGVWQGSRLRAGKGFALMGTTVAPGFEPPDFELGAREALRREYPAFAELIRELTRD